MLQAKIFGRKYYVDSLEKCNTTLGGGGGGEGDRSESTNVKLCTL